MMPRQKLNPVTLATASLLPKTWLLLGLLLAEGCLEDKKSPSTHPASTETMSLQATELTKITGPLIATPSQQLEFVVESGAQAEVSWAINGNLSQDAGAELRLQAPTESFIVEARLKEGDATQSFRHHVSVLTLPSEWSCATETQILGQTQGYVGEILSLQLMIPDCIKDFVTGIHWKKSTGETLSSSSDMSLELDSVGEIAINIDIELFGGEQNIPLQVFVYSLERPQNHPTPSPQPSPQPSSPEAPTPQHECETLGETQLINSNTQEEILSCGLQGYKNLTYLEKEIRTCTLVGEQKRWMIRHEKELVEESLCQGQACLHPDNQSHIISHLSQLTLVSSTPITKELTCPHGELGYYELWEQEEKWLCDNGNLQLIEKTPHRLLSRKDCPQYAWVPTEDWSECSANCGGTQIREQLCLDQYGQKAKVETYCASEKPKELRVCSKNPEAAAYEEKIPLEQEPVAKSCPAGQIGHIVQHQTQILTKSYACVEHQIQLVKEEITETRTSEENLCRNYVAHRCSHDSLSISEAKGRFAWMQKCQNQIPAIKMFLDQAEEFGIRDQKGRTFDSERPLYVTFALRDPTTGKERPWVAPKSEQGECRIPAGAYIASVCVSSCATPEQLTLTQAQPNQAMRWQRWDEAHAQATPWIVTMSQLSFNSPKNFQHTKVDTWVTELFDTEHDIVRIMLRSGREIRLTPNHPVLVSSGELKLVSELTTNDALVTHEFKADPIRSLRTEKHFGKVYNVYPHSSALAHNMILVGGYWTGSAMFQNEAADQLNRRLVRGRLKELILQTK